MAFCFWGGSGKGGSEIDKTTGCLIQGMGKKENTKVWNGVCGKDQVKYEWKLL